MANLPLRKGANQRPIKLIHRLNACHVQFNVVDTKTLLDAQRNPEQYRDLVVRVAGYSALFVALEMATHDDTSSLTIHDFCIPVRSEPNPSEVGAACAVRICAEAFSDGRPYRVRSRASNFRAT